MTDFTFLIAPIVLGTVAWPTEFVPLSSTGHLRLTEWPIGYKGRQAGIVGVVR